MSGISRAKALRKSCLCSSSTALGATLRSFFPSSSPQLPGWAGLRSEAAMQCGCSCASASQLTTRSFAGLIRGPPSPHPPPQQRHCLRRRIPRQGEWEEIIGPFGLVGNGGGDGSGLYRREKGTNGVRSMGSKSKEEPRGSLWRSRSVISKETVLAVHDLKRQKDNPQELAKVFQMRISRLLKVDLLATLSEMQRQNEIELSLRLFETVKKEIWYKPDRFLYRQMMDALGRNRRIPEIEKKFQQLQDEGIAPEVVIYREMVGAYIRSHMLTEALAMHAKMVEAGCGEDPLTLQFIDTGREKEAVRLKQRRKAAEKLKAEQENEESNDDLEEQDESSSTPEMHPVRT